MIVHPPVFQSFQFEQSFFPSPRFSTRRDLSSHYYSQRVTRLYFHRGVSKLRLISLGEYGEEREVFLRGEDHPRIRF